MNCIPTYNDTDKSQHDNVECKKPDKKKNICYLILLMLNSRKCRLTDIDMKYISGCLEMEWMEEITKRHVKTFGLMGMVIILTMVVISQVYTHDKTDQLHPFNMWILLYVMTLQ